MTVCFISEEVVVTALTEQQGSVWRVSPVASLHVALAHRAGGALHVGGDSVLSLEQVVEVAVTLVSALVPHDLNDWGSGEVLGGGEGDGGQAGEDDLQGKVRHEDVKEHAHLTFLAWQPATFVAVHAPPVY